MTTFVLIDAGYLNNYRFYATKLWFKKAHSEDYPENEKDYDWSENSIFMEKYKKIYEENLINLKSKYKTSFKNMIIACDCKKSKIWRLPLFKEYKLNRDKLKESKNVGSDIQEFTYKHFLPYLKDKLKINLLQQQNSEADDIIAISCKFIKNKYKDSNIIIIANDKDYLQLLENNINIYNIKGDSLSSKSIGTNKEDLLSKIIMGDPADNIKGCFNRCGIKTAIKYAKNKELLEEAFKKNEGSIEKFKLNSMIIDFNNIPLNIASNINNNLKEITFENIQDKTKTKHDLENNKITSYFTN